MGPIPIAPLNRTRVYIHIRISKDTRHAKGQATGPSIPDAGPKKTQEDALQGVHTFSCGCSTASTKILNGRH